MNSRASKFSDTVQVEFIDRAKDDFDIVSTLRNPNSSVASLEKGRCLAPLAVKLTTHEFPTALSCQFRAHHLGLHILVAHGSSAAEAICFVQLASGGAPLWVYNWGTTSGRHMCVTHVY